MGNRCYTINKNRKNISSPSSFITTSTIDTIRNIENEPKEIKQLNKKEKKINFDFSKKPIMKKLLEKNKMKVKRI